MMALKLPKGCVSCCESPIEELFLAALLEGCGSRWVGCLIGPAPQPDHYPDTSEIDVLDPASGRKLGIIPQEGIDEYRADFAISLFSRDGDDLVMSVVECDGHDYHERTKEQARRDRARDRHMQACGYVVLRYTGSEIWGNPAECVVDFLDTLEDLLDRKEREQAATERFIRQEVASG